MPHWEYFFRRGICCFFYCLYFEIITVIHKTSKKRNGYPQKEMVFVDNFVEKKNVCG